MQVGWWGEAHLPESEFLMAVLWGYKGRVLIFHINISFFPYHLFIMMVFKHVQKCKELYNVHPYTDRLDSITFISILSQIYLIHLPTLYVSVNLLYIKCVSKWVAVISIVTPKYFNMHILNILHWSSCFFYREVKFTYSET